MALDRFIDFEGVPSTHDVECILEDFFTGGAADIRWHSRQSRFYVRLHGKRSNPFRRISVPYAWVEEPEHEGRYIEVHMGQGSIDVLTRVADEYTNGIADRLEQLFIRLRTAQGQTDGITKEEA